MPSNSSLSCQGKIASKTKSTWEISLKTKASWNFQMGGPKKDIVKHWLNWTRMSCHHKLKHSNSKKSWTWSNKRSQMVQWLPKQIKKETIWSSVRETEIKWSSTLWARLKVLTRRLYNLTTLKRNLKNKKNWRQWSISQVLHHKITLTGKPRSKISWFRLL